MENNLTAEKALFLVAMAKFERFTPSDYDAFGGVESDNPMLGEYNDWLIIIDGKRVDFDDPETGASYTFDLNELYTS